jgi:hypothetical protein
VRIGEAIIDEHRRYEKSYLDYYQHRYHPSVTSSAETAVRFERRILRKFGWELHRRKVDVDVFGTFFHCKIQDSISEIERENGKFGSLSLAGKCSLYMFPNFYEDDD